MAMGLRLRVAANGAATSALRHAVAPCACPLRMAGGLAARTLVQRRFATKSASHVKYSEKKTKLPVILLQDCNLGRAGDEVQVSPGYMRNYLYERKVAVHSTLENKRKYYVQRSVQDRTAFLRPARIAAALSSNPLIMYRHVEAGQQRPKSEVTAEHIVDKLAKRRIELTPEQVELQEPITEIGDHVVHVQLERGHEASLVVTVEPR